MSHLATSCKIRWRCAFDSVHWCMKSGNSKGNFQEENLTWFQLYFLEKLYISNMILTEIFPRFGIYITVRKFRAPFVHGWVFSGMNGQATRTWDSLPALARWWRIKWGLLTASTRSEMEPVFGEWSYIHLLSLNASGICGSWFWDEYDFGIWIYSPSVSHKHAPGHSTMEWEAMAGHVPLLHRSRDRHGRCRERLGTRYLKICGILPCAKVLEEPSTQCRKSCLSQGPKNLFKLVHHPRHILLHCLHCRQYRQWRWGCFRCFWGPFCHSCDLGFLAEAPQQTLCLKCITHHKRW